MSTYTHCFEVTVVLLVHLESDRPEERLDRATQEEIYARAARIMCHWDGDDVEAHSEGKIEYVETTP